MVNGAGGWRQPLHPCWQGRMSSPGVLGDDPDVKVADEDKDLGAGPAPADTDVVEPAGVAQDELAVGIDAVAAEKAELEDRWLAVAENISAP
jgi:hypothetical protein